MKKGSGAIDFVSPSKVHQVACPTESDQKWSGETVRGPSIFQSALDSKGCWIWSHAMMSSQALAMWPLCFLGPSKYWGPIFGTTCFMGSKAISPSSGGGIATLLLWKPGDSVWLTDPYPEDLSLFFSIEIKITVPVHFTFWRMFPLLMIILVGCSHIIVGLCPLWKTHSPVSISLSNLRFSHRKISCFVGSWTCGDGSKPMISHMKCGDKHP